MIRYYMLWFLFFRHGLGTKVEKVVYVLQHIFIVIGKKVSVCLQYHFWGIA